MSPEEFVQLLALARLQLPDAERDLILRQINEIIEHIHRISSISLPDDAPYFYPNQCPLPLRPDEPSSASFRETMMRNAPATHGPYISCPPVIPSRDIGSGALVELSEEETAASS